MNKTIFCAAAAAVLSTSAFAEVVHPYGVCAHVTRSERGAHRLKGTLDAMEMAGIRYVRSDFDSWAILKKDGSFDFSNYDRLLDELDARGVKLLPILYGYEGGRPPADMERYKAYLRAIISHYGRRMPVVEIWNEANLNGFFKGADPVLYAKTLQAAYEVVKSVDPEIRVAFTGTAGVPLDYIRKVFEAGAAKSFDIMNVHPYSHPAQPEGSMDVQTEKLRALMTEFGCGDKPIWFTEIGWPTHTVKVEVSFPSILLAGLKTARPDQKTWNVVLADLKVDGAEPEQDLANELRDLLPPGSRVRVCTQKETCRLLDEGGVDAVVYPFDESFPADTLEAVNAFIRKGGVLVDFGGMPCYFGRRGSESVAGMQHGGAAGRFPFGFRAWWLDKAGTYPEEAPTFATEAGLAAGVKQEPTGFLAKRFLAPDRIGEASEWIPLVAGRTTNGVDLVSAAVVRYRGERTGAAVLCSLFPPRYVLGTNSEENQAKFTTRGLAIAFAEGVEAYFPYNLRSFEEDPYYSEHHFGLMHADFTPKPAYAAYGAFTRMRPAGSLQRPGAWHDKDRRFFHPQWTRPDGKKAGLVWRLGAAESRKLKFTGGKPTFYNYAGRKIGVRDVGDGVYSVPVSDSPVYFVGAELAQGK